MAPFFISLALAAQCVNYSVKCQCGLSTPFEGFQIYVVEKCDKEEQWHSEYGHQQFSTAEECAEGISSDVTCQNLPN